MLKKIFLFSFLSTLFFTSCNLLDQVSPNDLDADTAIKDAASAEAALIGVYSAMQNSSYYGGAYPLVGEAASDNAVTGGYAYLSLDQLTNKDVTAANIIIEELWYNLYRVVANANRLLEALPKITDLDAVRKAEIEGQCRAIRAMVHFDLLRYFGEHWDSNSKYGIPVIAKTQSITDVSSRATVAENYKFIEDELTAALAQVSAEDTRVQYVNAATVNALLARVMLYHGNKAQAATYASVVIDNQAFSLVASGDYTSIFNSRRTTESVFELAFDNQNRSGYNGLTYARAEALRPEITYMASENLIKFFASRPTDVRAALISSGTQNDISISPDGRCEKYRGEETQDNPAYILRLAEQYLIRAEAKGKTDGLADLNTIRIARGMSELTAADMDTDEKFLKIVLEERRAEFNFEGHRLFDLARTRNIKNVVGVDDFRGIMPIPAREISASNGKYEQNPGY